MHARLSLYEGDADQLTTGFQAATDPLEKVDGFSKAYFAVDKNSGRAFSLTLWESQEALERSVEEANKLRDEATQPSGAEIKSVEHYEVTVTAGNA
jgi:heme-degrading monooxygenase HmoA